MAAMRMSQFGCYVDLRVTTGRARDRKTLEIVGNIQPEGMIGAGHQIAVDSKGNLYVAQTTAGMQKLTFKGMSPAGRR